MATAAYSIVYESAKAKVIKWTLKHVTDPAFDERVGAPYVFSGRYPDKSVQMFGTFSTGVVKLEGSNEVAVAPTSWVSLNDPNGNELTFATATKRIEQVLENPMQIRPNMTTLAADVEVTVLLLIKGR
jgi:hypothetical protein